MATGVNYWSSYELSYKVSDSVWGGEQESSSEEGGGGVTWETQAMMEVKGQLISAPDRLTCPDRKQRERMGELQERRRSLQALLSARLAELRRICLQEAELTGAVPSDFPLEAGEKPPCVRRRGGTSRQANRKCRVEEDESQRSKPKKTLFSGALRKYSDSEHNTHTHTHTHHGKRTVHRGCHTDDTVRSESSSTSDSTGHDNEDGLSQCRPPLVAAGSPVEVFYQNKTRRNSLLNRTEHPETLQTHKPLPLPLPPSHPPQLHAPPPPPRSQDSSSSGPSDPGAGGEGGVRLNAARSSNSSDVLLDRITSPEEEQQGGLWVNGLPASSRGTNVTGGYWGSETQADGRTRRRKRSSVQRRPAGLRLGETAAAAATAVADQPAANHVAAPAGLQRLLVPAAAGAAAAGSPAHLPQSPRRPAAGHGEPDQILRPVPASAAEPGRYPQSSSERHPARPSPPPPAPPTPAAPPQPGLAAGGGDQEPPQGPRPGRTQRLVPEEHRRLLPPEPGQWKGDRGRSQRERKRRGQRPGRRRRSFAAQADDSRCHPAGDLSDGGESSSSRRAAPQTDAAAFGHVPRTPAARQVGRQLALHRLVPFSETGSLPHRPAGGPTVSWDSRLTHRPIRTLRGRRMDQSQPGFLPESAACGTPCPADGIKRTRGQQEVLILVDEGSPAENKSEPPKTPPTVMSHRG